MERGEFTLVDKQLYNYENQINKGKQFVDKLLSIFDWINLKNVVKDNYYFDRSVDETLHRMYWLYTRDR